LESGKVPIEEARGKLISSIKGMADRIVDRMRP
jgi:hypothetical protein